MSNSLQVDPERNKQLDKRIKLTDHGLTISVVVTLVIVLATLAFIVYQNLAIQNKVDGTLQQSMTNATANHKKTQQYVRCLAEVLLQPLDQRTEAAFDKCSDTGVYTDTDTSTDTNQ